MGACGAKLDIGVDESSDSDDDSPVGHGKRKSSIQGRHPGGATAAGKDNDSGDGDDQGQPHSKTKSAPDRDYTTPVSVAEAVSLGLDVLRSQRQSGLVYKVEKPPIPRILTPHELLVLLEQFYRCCDRGVDDAKIKKQVKKYHTNAVKLQECVMALLVQLVQHWLVLWFAGWVGAEHCE